jgi:FkbM family methyltransferase
MILLNYLKSISRDAMGISRACGPLVAIRWLLCIGVTLPECLRTGNLQPADRRMGDGPFAVTRGAACAQLIGRQVFSGIREIWVRDVYLRNDYLEISKGALVVDLGANLGNFTNLALAQHPDVRVIAVEPSLTLSESLRSSVAHNGWTDRTSIIRAFVGATTEVQAKVADSPDYMGAPSLTENGFLDEFGITHIDFLKCDIEGSEFFMLERGSRILAITQNLAIEVHVWGGPVPAFLDRVEKAGFEIGSIQKDPSGTCIALCKKSSTSPRPAERSK